MWKQSVWTSTISSHLAALHLKPNGLLTLAGAKAALSGTGGMGYGMAKLLFNSCVRASQRRTVDAFGGRCCGDTTNFLHLGHRSGPSGFRQPDAADHLRGGDTGRGSAVKTERT
ncbi:hypothetical protein F7725_010528 [Dissostichus mawsoni]|uniref:Uncharacterized protein n=1 Tax=Dissostichus mawsoni TaxID=36200 RepID=A0A7J5XP20_DISMA|nr:hypothetical protein F7725_010528 [Dissostichus mawsoni]